MAARKTSAQAAAKIARERLGIETLESRGRDGLDFHDLHVDSIRAALEEAFLAGVNEAAARLFAGEQDAGLTRTSPRRPSLKETQAAQARARADRSGDRFVWKEGDITIIKPGDE